MAVKIGSARGSFGNTSPGDQSGGKEVSTQEWYNHSKGWRAFVCTVPGAMALIAEAMRKACANNDIGYSQPDRLSLWNNVKDKGFDPSRTTKKVNTDCSALVCVCIQYAFAKLGINYTMPNFITSNEPSALLNSGYFKELTASRYLTQSAYLAAGVILDTKTKGHTVVVLENGAKCDIDTAPAEYAEDSALGGRILRNGMSGNDVREMQSLLIQLGYDLGKWGADGDFGDDTEAAVRLFQSEAHIGVDGEFGPESLRALNTELEILEASLPEKRTGHIVMTGNSYVRTGPSTQFMAIDVACIGNEYEFTEEDVSGWRKIRTEKGTGWVSGRYAEEVGA